MNLLVYSSGIDAASERLMEVVTTLAVNGTTEIFHSLENLTARLNRPKDKQTIVVVHVATEKELLHVLSIYDFLQNIKLILILPDREEPTVAKGHKLHPRFLSYADSDFSDIGAVLNKMSGNELPKNSRCN